MAFLQNLADVTRLRKARVQPPFIFFCIFHL